MYGYIYIVYLYVVKWMVAENYYFTDIITESGHHSSGSGLDESEGTALSNILLIAEDVQIDLKDNLLAFENTTPRYMKNKRLRRQKKKEKKNSKSY